MRCCWRWRSCSAIALYPDKINPSFVPGVCLGFEARSLRPTKSTQFCAGRFVWVLKREATERRAGGVALSLESLSGNCQIKG
ncbi:MAG: hypothetical protein ACRCT1_01190 [Microcoleaceae cyanobacterium]